MIKKYPPRPLVAVDLSQAENDQEARGGEGAGESVGWNVLLARRSPLSEVPGFLEQTKGRGPPLPSTEQPFENCLHTQLLLV